MILPSSSVLLPKCSFVAGEARTTVSATLNNLNPSATLNIVPGVLTVLGLSPSTVKGGTNVTAKVTLDAFAPPGGAVVAMGSNKGAAIVPGIVTVPAGQKSATFKITTSAVTAKTSINITAVYNGVTKTRVLTLTP